jgi:protein arginine N-methyltransferase 5
MSNKHKRISSLTTRPPSVHQSTYGAILPVAPNKMRVPSAASSTLSAKSGVIQFASGDLSSTWELWDCIRSMCGHHPRLSVSKCYSLYKSSLCSNSVALDLTNPLPPSAGALARWTAEPVRNIWLPAASFIANAKGYPVLSKACQAFIRGLSKVLCILFLFLHC